MEREQEILRRVLSDACKFLTAVRGTAMSWECRGRIKLRKVMKVCVARKANCSSGFLRGLTLLVPGAPSFSRVFASMNPGNDIYFKWVCHQSSEDSFD